MSRFATNYHHTVTRRYVARKYLVKVSPQHLWTAFSGNFRCTVICTSREEKANSTFPSNCLPPRFVMDMTICTPSAREDTAICWIKIYDRAVKAGPSQGRSGQLLTRQQCCLWNVINAVTVGDDKKLQLFVVRFVKNQYLCRDVSFIVLKWQSIYNTAVTSSYKVRVRKLSYWLSLVFICRENPRRWGLSLFADRKKVPDRLGFSRHMKTRL